MKAIKSLFILALVLLLTSALPLSVLAVPCIEEVQSTRHECRGNTCYMAGEMSPRYVVIDYVKKTCWDSYAKPSVSYHFTYDYRGCC